MPWHFESCITAGTGTYLAALHCATSPESSPNTSLRHPDSQDAASGHLGSPGLTGGTEAAAANRQPGVFVRAKFAKSRAATGARMQTGSRRIIFLYFGGSIWAEHHRSI